MDLNQMSRRASPEQNANIPSVGGRKRSPAQDIVGNADDEPRKPAEKPVSLRPLEFEEAVRGLLRVRPDPKR